MCSAPTFLSDGKDDDGQSGSRLQSGHQSALAEKGSQGPVRIELQFTGCCDPSLGLIVDTRRESDVVEEMDGLTFVIDPQT